MLSTGDCLDKLIIISLLFPGPKKKKKKVIDLTNKMKLIKSFDHFDSLHFTVPASLLPHKLLLSNHFIFVSFRYDLTSPFLSPCYCPSFHFFLPGG